MSFFDDVLIEVYPQPDNLPGEMLDLLFPAIAAREVSVLYQGACIKLAYEQGELVSAMVLIEGLQSLPLAFNEHGLLVRFVRLSCASPELARLPHGLYLGDQYGFSGVVVGVDADGTVPSNLTGQPRAFATGNDYSDTISFFRLVASGGLLPDERTDGFDPLHELFGQNGDPPTR